MCLLNNNSNILKLLRYSVFSENFAVNVLFLAGFKSYKPCRLVPLGSPIFEMLFEADVEDFWVGKLHSWSTNHFGSKSQKHLQLAGDVGECFDIHSGRIIDNVLSFKGAITAWRTIECLGHFDLIQEMWKSFRKTMKRKSQRGEKRKEIIK